MVYFCFSAELKRKHSAPYHSAHTKAIAKLKHGSHTFSSEVDKTRHKTHMSDPN